MNTLHIFKAFSHTLPFDSRTTVVTTKQTHSNLVNVVSDPRKECEGDGLVTTLPHLALRILTADCVPLVLMDEVHGVVGVAHAGWKGILSNIVKETIRAMLRVGAKTNDITCVLGPSIGPCCYEIFGERKTQFETLFANHSNTVFQEKEEQTMLDLRQCVRMQLIAEGVLTKHIAIHDDCTQCSEKHYPSYHRDRSVGGQIETYVWME